MTYVRKYGRPDLFITITCNPKWPEILRYLIPGQTSSDRHDITARVFRQKQKSLMDFIGKQSVFGEVRCWMYSIEWQKRGLPHSHTLIWLVDKVHPDQIDNIISAEIPDSEIDPELFDIVTTHMMHGPCGQHNPESPCMAGNKCTKRYPRPLHAETISGNDGYPLYRRRSQEDNGKNITMKVKGNNVVVDNSWIVPYSPLLSKTFKTHCNIELCNSIKSIKYVCKYVNKGSDMAVFGIDAPDANDEVTRYQLGRYVSCNEAIWRIFSFPIHERHPTVVNLAVHLENGQRVYFTEANAAQRAERAPNTTLTSFFNICQSDQFARTLLYSEVPQYYTWNIASKMFQRRKQGQAVPAFVNVFSTDALGRIYTVHPLAELNATTVELWNKYKDYMADDILHRVRTTTLNYQLEMDDGIHNEALLLIEDLCLLMSGSSLDKLGMAAPNRAMHDALNRELEREREYDIDALNQEVRTKIPLLTNQQKDVYDTLLKAVDEGNEGIYFIDAPGGTGKTFLISLLLDSVRSRSEVAVAVASSGIAATLLGGGRTAHSAFKLPLNLQLTDEPTCNISKNSVMAKVLQNFKIIIWDECTMANKRALEALDRTMRDLRSNARHFGGALIVLAGDFRQTLPVIPRSTAADAINACLKLAHLWRFVKKLKLTTNMRVLMQNDSSADVFSNQLFCH
ncbi:uncharacterized protein LOC129728491 [Wyeomyia smithii]|uniref:uncharacterized protein LOC129728491 n=1 Tax=Wyeomyia smithii TaxID=174621 RepID=UPI002467E794|nr:uncharacterized protein LOC129728491 [Wyeomyia smithii]